MIGFFEVCDRETGTVIEQVRTEREALAENPYHIEARDRSDFFAVLVDCDGARSVVSAADVRLIVSDLARGCEN